MQTIPDCLAEGILPPPLKKRRFTGDPTSNLDNETPSEPAPSDTAIRRAMQAILPDILESTVALLLPTLLQNQPEIKDLLAEMSRTSKVQRDLLQVAQSTQTGYDSLAVGALMQAPCTVGCLC